VAAYAGYPMAMSASRVVDRTFLRLDGVERLPERAPAESKSDAQRRAAAADVIRTLTGGRAAPDPEEAFANIVGSLGDVGRLAFEWAFGEVWCRPQLSRRDRSLLVIAILAWLSRERELAFHVPAGLNHGLTREEITEVTVQLCIYGGFPRAVDAYPAVQEAFAKVDRRASP
jgi:4-carboxymuconolactone decarboxylase